LQQLVGRFKYQPEGATGSLRNMGTYVNEVPGLSPPAIGLPPPGQRTARVAGSG
jgi:hypothetical protein